MTPSDVQKSRLKDIRALVDICLAVLIEKHGDDYNVLADMTGLCVSTIYRLARHDFTTAIHVNTLMSLGDAIGFKLEMSKGAIRLNIRK